MTRTPTAKEQLKKQLLIFAFSLLSCIVIGGVLLSVPAEASSPAISIDLTTAETADGSLGTIEVLFLLLQLALLPSILLMTTSFTRIIIVLSFLRNALGTQQSPPNQILIGLALALTLFIMTPVIQEVNTVAYEPYKEGQITQQEAMDAAVKPIKTFMLKQTQKKDLSLFLSIKHPDGQPDLSLQSQEQLMELGLDVVIPSFVTSELKRAFTMGFLLFIPFLIIDMIVASTLMSMGMVMLPPSMIALPFKIMIFVLVDGWSLLLGTLAQSFR